VSGGAIRYYVVQFDAMEVSCLPPCRGAPPAASAAAAPMRGK